MTAQQLALDVLATTRIIGVRHTLTPEQHQRGWITLPREIAAHPLPGRPRPAVGDVLPAWLCCICGGVELSWHRVDRSHGCCDPDTIRMPCERRDRWPGWALDFDPHWTPDHPGRYGCGGVPPSYRRRGRVLVGQG